MRPRPRTVAAIFIATAFMVIISTGLMFWTGSYSLQLHAREQSRRAVILDLEWILAALKDAENSQRGYLLSGDETYLQLLNEAARQLGLATAKIKDAGHKEISYESIQTIVRLVQDKMTDLRAGADQRRNRNDNTVVSFSLSQRGSELMAELRERIGTLEKEQVEKMQSDSRLIDETIRLRTLVFLLFGCGNILFLGWAYHRIGQAIEEREAAAILHRRP